MSLRPWARRWATAGLLAAAATNMEGVTRAQGGVAFPAIPSAAGSPPIAALPLTGAPNPSSGIIPALPPIDSAAPLVMPAAPGMQGASAAPGCPQGCRPTAPAGGGQGSSPCGGQGGSQAGSQGSGQGNCGGFDWSKVPPVPFRPLPGYFTVFPTGPGYYSLLDQLQGNYRQKAPPWPYPRFGLNPYSFFDFSFAYLDNPNNTFINPLDPLKRIHPTDNWLLSIGGEFRYRHQGETDYLGNRFGINNTGFDLYRTRLFGDLWYKNLFRIYAEGIDARADFFNPPLVPGPNDQNHFDLLNIFTDVKIPFLDEGTSRNSYVRVGRQELTYGSQRLVSPVEFANTRVNFEGVKAFSHGQKFDVDLFLVQPVIHLVDRFDIADRNQVFSGAWATYRPVTGQAMDLYWLNLSNANHIFTQQNRVTQPSPTAPTAPGPSGGTGQPTNPNGPALAQGGYDVNTLGSRYAGSYQNFLFDFEGMYQFGTWVNQLTSAGATVADVGYVFRDVPWLPQFWVCYEWASGGANTGHTHNTFNQLFAFGHYYFGAADIVGRQNINDVFGQFVFFPTNWITVNTQYHNFWLANSRDALYNATGGAIRLSPNGAAGVNVGQELDFLVNFHLDTYQDFQIAYSRFFSGSYMSRTGSGKDIDFYYMQYTFRF